MMNDFLSGFYEGKAGSKITKAQYDLLSRRYLADPFMRYLRDVKTKSAGGGPTNCEYCGRRPSHKSNCEGCGAPKRN